MHPRFRTPHVAILLSAGMATLGVLGCHLAGDWFLGVDILVTSMLINFLLMALSVLALPARNPRARRRRSRCCRRGRSRCRWRWPASLVLALYPGRAHLAGPDRAGAAWYFKSTPVWAIVMALATVVYSNAPRDAGATARARASDARPRAVRARFRPEWSRMPWPSTDRSELDASACPELSISRVVTGLWQIADMERDGRTLDLDATARAMQPYIDAGFTSFDMADHYGSAELIAGRARPHEGEGRRARAALHQVGAEARAGHRRRRARRGRAVARSGCASPAIDLLQFHAWNYADPIVARRACSTSTICSARASSATSA